FVGNYIRGLFTTHSTINDIWRSAPNAHGHTFSFASTRSTGFTALMDPDIASGGSYSGYYRSMVAKPSLTSDSVTGATAADTGTDPTDFTVPGNAAVVTPGAPLYAAPGDASAAATMPAGTRLRVLSAPTQTTATGGGILQVKGLDDSSLSGYAAKADLTPKDSVAPRIYSIDSVPAFSPNGDGRDDTYTLGARLSETADWQVTIRTGTTTLGSDSGRGSTVAATWNGLVGGNPVADGTYAYRLSVDDGWNAPTVMTGQLVVDTTAPALTGLTPGPDVITTFSPNGDTYRDTAAFAATSSEKGQFVARVRDTAGTLLRTMTVDAPSGQATIGWNGRNNAGAAVPDGQYTVSVVPRDAVGNTGAATNRTVRVNTILGFTRASTILFFPQDLDRLNRTTTLSFTLTRPAKVTWTIHRGDVVVRTRYQAVDLPAGSYSWSFDGRGDDGVMLPRGRYRAVVDVTDSAGTVSQAATFDMDAFTIRASTTLARGKRVTFTVRSAETLRSNPRLTIYEPGLTSWGVTMSKVATKTYRVTITLKSGGSAGTMRLRASGFDYDGRYQRTTLPFALH
ncbi:MAG: FlgD immunoglobulin-like domain containing protein, partial [Chloroflexota bacterium]